MDVMCTGYIRRCLGKFSFTKETWKRNFICTSCYFSLRPFFGENISLFYLFIYLLLILMRILDVLHLYRNSLTFLLCIWYTKLLFVHCFVNFTSKCM